MNTTMSNFKSITIHDCIELEKIRDTFPKDASDIIYYLAVVKDCSIEEILKSDLDALDDAIEFVEKCLAFDEKLISEIEFDSNTNLYSYNSIKFRDLKGSELNIPRELKIALERTRWVLNQIIVNVDNCESEVNVDKLTIHDCLLIERFLSKKYKSRRIELKRVE